MTHSGSTPPSTETELRRLRLAITADLVALKCSLIKWYIGLTIAQTAIIAGLLELVL